MWSTYPKEGFDKSLSARLIWNIHNLRIPDLPASSLSYVVRENCEVSEEPVVLTLIIVALVSKDWKVGLFGSGGSLVPIL